MKNQAKWAGQIRHWIGWLAGVFIAVGVASVSDAEMLVQLVNSTFADISGLIGVIVVIGVKIASWRSPAKNVGEGD